jgi:signal transduction histidine kinase
MQEEMRNAPDTQAFEATSMLGPLADSIPALFMVLNSERRIVFANRQMAEIAGVKDAEVVIGQRPGDVLLCEHAHAEHTTCGNTRHCSSCQTQAGILNAQRAGHSQSECRMRNAHGRSFDFKLSANTFEQDGRIYTAVTLLDISSEKRREVLERLFFHDLLNSVAGIEGLMDVLDVTSPDVNEKLSIVDMARRCAHQLGEDITSARALARAEDGSLVADSVPVGVGDMMDISAGFFINNDVCGEARLEIHKPETALTILSDASLLNRVLVNLIKNAFEASKAGGVVRFSATKDSSGVLFEVHNDTVMPEAIKQQLFERSFSTKGRGRGIGTYSVKLFTEKYLSGRVWFTSHEGFGTSFFVQLPLVRENGGKS